MRELQSAATSWSPQPLTLSHCPYPRNPPTQPTHPTPPHPADLLEQVQLGHLPTLCHSLFYSGAYRALHPPLLRGGVPGQLMAQLAPAVSRLAVLLALPAERRPPGITWAAARPLATLFTIMPLNAAVDQWFGQASSSQLVALLAGSAQLVAQLPTDERPVGLQAGADEHSATATTVCYCLGMLSQKAAAPLPARALGSAERKRLAPPLLAAIVQLPGVLRLMAAGLEVPEAPVRRNSEELQVTSAASGRVASLAVSSVSSLTALLQEWLDADAGFPASGQRQRLPLMQGVGDALPWARAATAALRCGPALAAIDRQLDRLPAGRPPRSAGNLSPSEVMEQLLLLATRAVTAVSACTDAATLPLPAGCPPLAEVRAVLWSLHTAGCRWARVWKRVGKPGSNVCMLLICCKAVPGFYCTAMLRKYPALRECRRSKCRCGVNSTAVHPALQAGHPSPFPAAAARAQPMTSPSLLPAPSPIPQVHSLGRR